MLYKEVLPKRSYDLLEEIMLNQDFDDFYLAGGTALALQLGHRISIDLDFFTQSQFPISLLNAFPDNYTTNYARRNSIQVISRETKVEFIYWAFPITKEKKVVQGLRLLDPIDIGLMKLLAIQGRTTKKDIVDLYIIDKEVIKLEELIKLFQEHYPKESFNLYQSFKDIFNTKKIHSDPMPNMNTECNFNEIFEMMKELVIGVVKKDFLS